jgi:hypothetical protein
MTEAVEAESTHRLNVPSASSRVRRTLVGVAPGAIVATATFWLAYDGGTFGVAGRSAAAVIVWWALATGLALGVLPRTQPSRSLWLVLGGLAVYSALSVSSSAWGAAPAAAFNELNRVVLYAGVCALVAFAVAEHDATTWTDGLALGLVSVASLALASRLLPHVVRISSYDALAIIPQGAQRLSYPVGYWNGLAALGAIAAPLLLRTATAASAPLARAAAVGAMPILASTLYLTSSRTGIVACAVGVGVYFALGGRPVQTIAALVLGVPGTVLALYALRSHPVLVDGPFGTAAAVSAGRIVAIVILAVAIGTVGLFALLAVPAGRVRLSSRLHRPVVIGGLLLVALAIVLAHPVRLVQHFKQPPPAIGRAGYVQNHLLSANGSGRWQFWETAVREWQTKPVFGRGVGTYEAWQTQTGRLGVYVHDAHSLYLQTLGELGLAGLFALLAAFAGSVVALPRILAMPPLRRSAGVAALAGFLAFAVAAGVDWMWQLPVVAVVGMTLLGIVVATGRGPARQWRPVAKIAVCVLALLLIGAQALEAGSSRDLSASQAAARDQRLEIAHSRALAAAQLEPWGSAPYVQLALVDEKRGRLGAARGWIAAATTRDRNNWHVWAIAARLAAESGDIPEARRLLDRARTLNPQVSS